MLFDKVKEEHILQAFKDYEEKGLPNGFGASSTYDLIFDGEKYPPKAIMAYANYYATGLEPINNFKGGPDHECFKAFFRNGFQIEKKKSEMNEHLYKLKQDFLETWPIDQLEKMTINQYTDIKRENSFCYWLEHITRDLGSIVGGSSYKFGVYKMDTISKTESVTNKDNDGVYAWYTKYGNSANEAFETIKSLIVNVANYANNNNLSLIDNIDLGDAFKWKIAFMYSDFQVVNIFKSDALKFIVRKLYTSETLPENVGELNHFIISKKEDDVDFFEYTSNLWSHYDKYNSTEKEFKRWLIENVDKGSNKASSYLSAIKILINEFRIPIYTENDITVLEDLYEDLIENQKDPNGKYAYRRKSYGEKGFYSAAVKTYINFLNNDTSHFVKENDEDYDINKNKMIFPLNLILYGPPGTGKTYNTINKAISIVDPEFDLGQSRSEILNYFHQLVDEKLIVFTTFHQSLGYEDFIEGIKPLIKNEVLEENENIGQIEYTIEDGIFKDLVNSINDDKLAIEYSEDNLYVPQELFDDNIVKISLGDSTNPEDESIYQYCMDNNVMALGFGEEINFSGVSTRSDIREKYHQNNIEISGSHDFNVSAIERFILWAKKGRLVFASQGTKYIRAIGVVNGDYFCDPNTPIRYSQFKPVEWLHKDLKLPIKKVYNKLFSHQSIYVIYGNSINKEFFSGKKESIKNTKNRVIIIDEINRGNVSAIFGELITLIEKDKRLSMPNELSVTLPYSKDKFSVPSNLYIIGTMNTADRSVEALDTALRRRFEFEEMMPDYSVIKNEIVEGIKLSEVLETINKRIELLIDRDHCIGHSYFFNIDSTEKLALTFKNKIVPLLQEYFYGDYGKIGLVLGEGFVEKQNNSNVQFAKFNYENSNDFKNDTYVLKDISSSSIIEAIEILMGNNLKE